MKLRDKLERALDYYLTVEIIDKKMTPDTIRLLFPTIVYDILRYKFNNKHKKLKQMLNIETDQELHRYLTEILKVLLIARTFGEKDTIYLDTTSDKEELVTYSVYTLIYQIAKYLEERGFIKIIFSKHGRNELDEYDIEQLLPLFRKIFIHEID